MPKIPPLSAVVLACFAIAAAHVDARQSVPPAPEVVAEPPQPSPAAATVGVVLQTRLGDIRLELEPQRAPVTVANFLRYVDAGRFDGISFYRAMKLDPEGRYGLVQGGLQGDRRRSFGPIAHESPAHTGLSHRDGALSMARLDPGTATADFFIVIGDLVSLDGNADGSDPGYAVFGRVTEGMDIVRQMLDLPRDPQAGDEGMKGQMLAQPVRIATARRAPPSP
jgi:peptidyl-prolyl cis-trans isomerase A (cyclophilin A)